MKASLKLLCCIPAFAALPCLPAKAQSFSTPAAYNYILGDPSVIRPQSTFCSTASNISIGGYFGDLYIATWDLPAMYQNSEVVWQLKATNDPTATLKTGSLLYQGVQDLCSTVQFNQSTATMQLLVAYYKLNDGHYIDVYDMTSSPSAPLVYNNTITLSHSPVYGRIRIDNYGYDYNVLVWELPGTGLQTILGAGGNWGPITDIDGTHEESDPDVAFTSALGTITLAYASHNKQTNMVTVSSCSFYDLLLSSGSISPHIEDVNYVGSIRPQIVLDAPIPIYYAYGNTNWAYTYTTGPDVYVRFLNADASPAPQTVNVTSGALGNTSISGQYKFYAPTICYGVGGVNATVPGVSPGPSGQITVCWYATDGAGFNKYIGLEMKDNGSSLISSLDYMLLPNASTNYRYYNPAIALCKNTSYSWAADKLYATYVDLNDSTSDYQLHHAFHEVSMSVFSGKHKLPLILGQSGVQVYPNPAKDVLQAALELTEEADVVMELSQVDGRSLIRKQEHRMKGSQHFSIDISQLAAGNYMLTTYVSGKKLDSRKVSKID